MGVLYLAGATILLLTIVLPGGKHADRPALLGIFAAACLTALLLLVFWWLWRLRDHRHGTGWLFGMYLVLGGAERFLVEFVRAKDDRVFGPLSLAQLTSVGLILMGVYLLRRWREPVTAPVTAALQRPTEKTAAAAPGKR